jgi:hypothetical protein
MNRSGSWFYFVCVLLALVTASCEKEITVHLPPARQSLVVEASINQLVPSLNYVFISRTIDYFNPDLSLNGVQNAQVFITPGTVNGTDTIWNRTQTLQLVDISTIPPLDTLFKGFSGIYFNPLLNPQIGVPYLLEIDAEGKHITGVTTIPKVVEIDTVYWRQEVDKGDTNMFLSFEYTDGPEQNNYRLAMLNDSNSILIGWGSAHSFRTFDDAILNNGRVPYNFFNPFDIGDTIQLYLSSIGRREYLFWESFAQAANNGGPFATPVTVKSNITNAIGSFTGYGVSYRRVILR